MKRFSKHIIFMSILYIVGQKAFTFFNVVCCRRTSTLDLLVDILVQVKTVLFCVTILNILYYILTFLCFYNFTLHITNLNVIYYNSVQILLFTFLRMSEHIYTHMKTSYFFCKFIYTVWLEKKFEKFFFL